MRVTGFVVATDFPTVASPDEVNSHGQPRQVRVCDCPKRVKRFDTREEAEAFASEVNHSLVIPIRQ